jgi:hypothetical protein
VSASIIGSEFQSRTFLAGLFQRCLLLLLLFLQSFVFLCLFLLVLLRGLKRASQKAVLMGAVSMRANLEGFELSACSA